MSEARIQHQDTKTHEDGVVGVDVGGRWLKMQGALDCGNQAGFSTQQIGLRTCQGGCPEKFRLTSVMRIARLRLGKPINERLAHTKLETDPVEWAFLAIILPQSDQDYPEDKRLHKKDKSVEFRLQIDHARFRGADEFERNALLSDALKRSIELMAEFGVSEHDRRT